MFLHAKMWPVQWDSVNICQPFLEMDTLYNFIDDQMAMCTCMYKPSLLPRPLPPRPENEASIKPASHMSKFLSIDNLCNVTKPYYSLRCDCTLKLAHLSPNTTAMVLICM